MGAELQVHGGILTATLWMEQGEIEQPRACHAGQATAELKTMARLSDGHGASFPLELKSSWACAHPTPQELHVQGMAGADETQRLPLAHVQVTPHETKPGVWLIDGSQSQAQTGSLAYYTHRVLNRRTGEVVFIGERSTTAVRELTLQAGEYVVVLEVEDEEGRSSTRHQFVTVPEPDEDKGKEELALLHW
ncbi:MAG: hypothetical protein AB7P69_13640 [Candidatus Binatia bacterium]